MFTCVEQAPSSLPVPLPAPPLSPEPELGLGLQVCSSRAGFRGEVHLCSPTGVTSRGCCRLHYSVGDKPASPGFESCLST